jgi:hypothetical protein
MALKLGTENKRNVIIVGVLLCVLAYLAISQLVGGPSTPAPSSAPQRPVTARQAPAARNTTTAAADSSGPAAHKVAPSGLDPALHTERLLASESIEYAGSGRNIFSLNSAPVEIETAKASARIQQITPVYTPPPVQQAPAIDLKYFGYSASKEGKREAFLLHGDDIFEAAAGEIVNHRYKVVTVDIHSVQITDLSYNNTQTLQLLAN